MANISQPPAAAIPVPRSILVVYAHPDDESFGPSAVLAKYARLGSSVYGWFATRGEAGQSNFQLYRAYPSVSADREVSSFLEAKAPGVR